MSHSKISEMIWRYSSPWRLLRSSAGETINGLAEELDTSPRNLRSIESGSQSFKVGQVFKYAKKCGEDPVLFLIEIERLLSMNPSGKESSAERIAKKLHVEANPLRLLRNKQGLSANAFAERVGCDRFCVYKTETGTTKPQAMTLSRFAEVLGVDPEILGNSLREWREELKEKSSFDIIESHLKEEREEDSDGDN